jgi:hypothetical protein
MMPYDANKNRWFFPAAGHKYLLMICHASGQRSPVEDILLLIEMKGLKDRL